MTNEILVTDQLLPKDAMPYMKILIVYVYIMEILIKVILGIFAIFTVISILGLPIRVAYVIHKDYKGVQFTPRMVAKLTLRQLTWLVFWSDDDNKAYRYISVEELKKVKSKKRR